MRWELHGCRYSIDNIMFEGVPPSVATVVLTEIHTFRAKTWQKDIQILLKPQTHHYHNSIKLKGYRLMKKELEYPLIMIVMFYCLYDTCE